MSVIIHEDRPRYDPRLKGIFGVVFAVLIYSGIEAYLNEGLEAASFVLIPVVVVGLALYLVMPRRYQVLDDCLKVVMGGGFSIGYPFSTMKGIVQRSDIWFSINFVTTFSSKHVVYLIRTKGFPVAISPSEPQALIATTERAMALWKRTGGVG
ncbi:MAG: hypothetical protein AB1597_08615 [Chloroflexota bacterium]